MSLMSLLGASSSCWHLLAVVAVAAAIAVACAAHALVSSSMALQLTGEAAHARVTTNRAFVSCSDDRLVASFVSRAIFLHQF